MNCPGVEPRGILSIKSLVNKHLQADSYSVIWDGTDINDIKITSGLYFYRIQSGDLSQIKKLMLIK